MSRSQLYGLIARSVATPPDRAWVEFELRGEAQFSNGAPITVDDVVFSLETLRDQGRPNHRAYYGQVAKIERPAPGRVRFVFAAPNRELPLLLGLMPILSKSDWEGRDFSKGDLRPPLGSGPYVIESVDAGRRIVYRRDPDYWGASLAVNRGRHNFDRVEYVYFRDRNTLWEAFTSGGLDLYQDRDPAHWIDAYGFPAAARGEIVQTEIAHQRPSGMRGFVFNTRRPIFSDRRVRQAFAYALDFEWLNARFYGGGYQRIASYYSGSELGFADPASAEERSLLAPYAREISDGALEQGWRPPRGAGDGRNRRNLRRARKLLEEAGWRVDEGVLKNAAGAAFTFEILLSSSADERVAKVFAEALKTLGVTATPRLVDRAQYTERRNAYDFDMIVNTWWLSLSPGEEQRFYWGSGMRETLGSRNYMGVASPAVDGAIDAMLEARDREAFQVATRALDRVLSDGVYVAPLGYLATDRIAHRATIAPPERAPLYGFRLDVWRRLAP